MPGVRALINPRQTSAITYGDSPLNAADDRLAGFAAGPIPGAVLPECPLTIVDGDKSREGHLTDLITSRFTALLFDDAPAIPADLQALEVRLLQRQVPFKVVRIGALSDRRTAGPRAWDHTGRAFPMYGADAGTLYLVRPDGHVLARWRKPDAAAVGAAIEQVLQARSVAGAQDDRR